MITQRGALWSVLLTKHYLGGKIKRNERAGHVARMGYRRGTYSVLIRRSEGRNHFEVLYVDGRTILKWLFKEVV